MDEPHFTVGVSVQCKDGECGNLIRIVIDPVARSMTHVMVEPKHRQGLGRLVPLSLVQSSNGEVVLDCTMAEFEQLAIAEETDFLPGTTGYQGYDSSMVSPLPYFGLGVGGTALPITYDKLPLGEVSIRRGNPVHATDGVIGKVQGVVIDPVDHAITHVLLQEGHLWGRVDVAIPVSAVRTFGVDIELSISVQEVEDLPAIEINQHGS
jgi:sporulation protein YlmC with PRC-barrel domain